MDLRIERTYRSLSQAFVEMLEEGPYDDITVAALCERAMIRRTTFYKHFADKGEFFMFFLKSMRDEFERRVGAIEKRTNRERNKLMLKELLRFLREHERLAANAISSPNSALLFDALCEVIYNDNLLTLKDELASGRVQKEGFDAETKAAFVSGGILRMVRSWWAQGRPEGGEERMLAVLDAI